MSGETSSELVKQAQDLGKVTPRDHIGNLVKAALNAVPVVGGPIASLISDYIPASREKRVEEFTQRLAAEMDRMSGELNESYVKTDEFAYLFTRVYQNVTRDYQQEKLDAYGNILINALRVNVDASQQERYLVIAEQLTSLHLYVLSAFYSDARNEAKLGRPEFGVSGSLNQTLNTLLDIPGDQIKRCIFDLDQMGITNNVSGALMAMMTPHGAMQLEGRVTPFGRGFINFISSP